jgi:hypothetical protein
MVDIRLQDNLCNLIYLYLVDIYQQDNLYNWKHHHLNMFLQDKLNKMFFLYWIDIVQQDNLNNLIAQNLVDMFQLHNLCNQNFLFHLRMFLRYMYCMNFYP